MGDERWLPVAGYEGRYEVSDLGRVRSLDRTIRDDRERPRRLKGRILRAGSGRTQKYLTVSPSIHGVQGNPLRVHRLVMETFVGPCPVGMEVLHTDDDEKNNALSNLRYGTRAENIADRARNSATQQLGN